MSSHSSTNVHINHSHPLCLNLISDLLRECFYYLTLRELQCTHIVCRKWFQAINVQKSGYEFRMKIRSWMESKGLPGYPSTLGRLVTSFITVHPSYSPQENSLLTTTNLSRMNEIFPQLRHLDCRLVLKEMRDDCIVLAKFIHLTSLQLQLVVRYDSSGGKDGVWILAERAFKSISSLSHLITLKFDLILLEPEGNDEEEYGYSDGIDSYPNYISELLCPVAPPNILLPLMKLQLTLTTLQLSYHSPHERGGAWIHREQWNVIHSLNNLTFLSLQDPRTLRDQSWAQRELILLTEDTTFASRLKYIDLRTFDPTPHMDEYMSHMTGLTQLEPMSFGRALPHWLGSLTKLKILRVKLDNPLEDEEDLQSIVDILSKLRDMRKLTLALTRASNGLSQSHMEQICRSMPKLAHLHVTSQTGLEFLSKVPTLATTLETLLLQSSTPNVPFRGNVEYLACLNRLYRLIIDQDFFYPPPNESDLCTWLQTTTDDHMNKRMIRVAKVISKDNGQIMIAVSQ